MDVGLGIVLGAIVLVGAGALLIVRLAAATFRAPRSAAERTVLRAAGARALVLPLAVGVLVAAALAGTLPGTGLPSVSALLGASPLLVVAAGLLAFSALPSARRSAEAVTTALLEPRRPTAFVPPGWSGAVVVAAALLLVLAGLGLALDRPVSSGAAVVRWQPSVTEALASAFPSRDEALLVGASTLLVLAAGWSALRSTARWAALPGALAAAEPTMRAVPARIAVLLTGGAMAAVLGRALCGAGGQAWLWGTIPDDPATALALFGAPVLAVGGVLVLLAVAAWIAAVALAAALLRPARAVAAAEERVA